MLGRWRGGPGGGWTRSEEVSKGRRGTAVEYSQDKGRSVLQREGLRIRRQSWQTTHAKEVRLRGEVVSMQLVRQNSSAREGIESRE